MLYFTIPSLIHVSFFINNYPHFAHRNIINGYTCYVCHLSAWIWGYKNLFITLVTVSKYKESLTPDFCSTLKKINKNEMAVPYINYYIFGFILATDLVMIRHFMCICILLHLYFNHVALLLLF